MEINLELIKSTRTLKGISTLEMANIIGLKTQSQYWKRENGEYKFKPRELPLLCNALGISIEHLFL